MKKYIITGYHDKYDGFCWAGEAENEQAALGKMASEFIAAFDSEHELGKMEDESGVEQHAFIHPNGDFFYIYVGKIDDHGFASADAICW